MTSIISIIIYPEFPEKINQSQRTKPVERFAKDKRLKKRTSFRAKMTLLMGGVTVMDSRKGVLTENLGGRSFIVDGINKHPKRMCDNK